jgi:hypothetical protein
MLQIDRQSFNCLDIYCTSIVFSSSSHINLDSKSGNKDITYISIFYH